jgi:MFS family permease
VADIAPADRRGASFGLRQSLDTTGAFLGPLCAIGLMWWTANNFITVFWAAVLPAFLALALIIFVVREPARPPGLRTVRNPISLSEIKRLGAAYWQVVGIATVFTLARFSEAFLILRAQDVGVPIMLVPAVLVLMNVVYAVAAYPAGTASDRMNRTTLLLIGLAFLIAADLVIAFIPSIAGIALGVVLWGLHMGFTQGLLAALVADTSPPELRGTAYGFFNLLGGLAMLAASVMAGWLWDAGGPRVTFLTGAGFALISAIGLFALRGRINTSARFEGL